MVNSKTNRIRVAVSINEFGQWAAFGRWDMRDESSMEEANGNVGHDGPHACFYVEVDVAVPAYSTLEAAIAGDGKVVVVPPSPKPG